MRWKLSVVEGGATWKLWKPVKNSIVVNKFQLLTPRLSTRIRYESLHTCTLVDTHTEVILYFIPVDSTYDNNQGRGGVKSDSDAGDGGEVDHENLL